MYRSTAATRPTISSLPTFMPRPMPPWGETSGPRALDQVLAAEQQARALRAAQALAPGERHEVEALLHVLRRGAPAAARPRPRR